MMIFGKRYFAEEEKPGGSWKINRYINGAILPIFGVASKEDAEQLVHWLDANGEPPAFDEKEGVRQLYKALGYCVEKL